MFKSTNLFFAGIIEKIGSFMAPHKMLYSYAFAVWAAGIFVLSLFGLVPVWLMTLWIWSIPFIGVYALMAWLNHIGFFDKKRDGGRMERAESENSTEPDATGAQLLRARDKTRPDRR